MFLYDQSIQHNVKMYLKGFSSYAYKKYIDII